MRRVWVLAGAAAMLAAGAPGEAQVPDVPPGPCERVEERIPRAPLNVELVTVTHSAFAVTWLTCDGQGSPLPSDTTVSYGTSPDPTSWETVTLERGTAFHYGEVRGLEAGTTYYYQVFSDGLPGRYDRYHPGSFTSLSLPAGRFLFSFAVMPDVHIGVEVSGLATSEPFEFPPGYRSERPAARIMARAAVREINGLGIPLTLLPADNTSHGELENMEVLHRILERLHGDYLIARGAHDRPKQYPEAENECPPDGDCFRYVFFPERRPGHVFYGRRRFGFDFIALDSVSFRGWVPGVTPQGMGELSQEQLGWLEERLERDSAAGRPAVIFFHHPVSEWSTTLAVPPAVFGVRQDDAQRFLELAGRHDVRTVINAHTHRNWISYSPHTGRMPILEMGPVVEYPGGYSVIRVYEGGFTRSFWRLRCRFCREWVETTRWEYLGQYPHYTTGSLRDRNFTHRWDGPDVPGLPSQPFNVWPPAAPMEA